MITDIEQTIREYLPSTYHLSLATANNYQPWVCEVHFAYDDRLNLYFRSTEARRHSQEIAKNPQVAGNIVTQHAIDEKPRGVYFEGQAEKLDNVDQHHVAYQCLSQRFGFGPEILDEAQPSDGKKFYVISVSKYYLFDAKDSKPAQKYELAWSNR